VTYPVRVDLDAAPPLLKLGMSAALDVTLREASNALHIPSTAVRKVDGQSIVTLINPGNPARDIPIHIGDTFGSDVEVLSGLAEGDLVALLTPATAPTTARSL
jgi:multidrug efflux pump subunit AcrA (membrane-fusion protein)